MTSPNEYTVQILKDSITNKLFDEIESTAIRDLQNAINHAKQDMPQMAVNYLLQYNTKIETINLIKKLCQKKPTIN